MKRNSSLLLLVCCASLLGMAKPAQARAGESAAARVETGVDIELEKARTAWQEAAAEATKNHLRAVAARGDARSLLAAAMLWPQWQDDVSHGKGPAIAQEKRAWFDAARDARPRELLVAWVEASDCGGLSDHCDPEGALRFLLQAESGNAAVHLLALGVADRAGAKEAAEAHWQAAVAAGMYDPHALEISQLLYSAMEGASLPLFTPALAGSMGQSIGMNRGATPEELRDIGTMAVWAAVALPAFQFTRRCSADSLAAGTGQLQAECERIMALLAQDEGALISTLIGLKKMAELTADGADGAVWRERLRQVHWVYENAQDSMGSSAATRLPPDYLGWVMREGELPAMRRLLEAKRIPAAPPKGWLPRQADVRALFESADAAG